MGNNTSAAELTRQGAILGEKLRLPTTGGGTAKADHTGSELPPKVCVQGLSLSKMQRIQKQIEFEYPFLSNVYESILVPNNRLPDCPIVWANDQFERMTLYPKEDIIGRNCRFLQGEYTDPVTVYKVREAVKEGRSLDVEILNYRRDGVAFWNRFRILPVHKKGRTTGEVTHFIAIQKDVTLLKDLSAREPVDWSAPEVAMWLEANEYGHFGRTFVIKGIDGKHLFRLGKTELSEVLGIDAEPEEKNALWDLVNELRSEKKQAVAQHWQSAKQKAKTANILYRSPSGENLNDDVPDFWNKDKTNEDYRLPVKVQLEGLEQPVIFLMKRNMKLNELSQKIENTFGRPMALYFTDEDGDENQIAEEDDLEAAILTSCGGTVCLRGERTKYRLNKKSYELYVPLPVGILLTDLGGEILFANPSVLKLANETQLQGRNIRDILECSAIRKAEDIKEGGDGEGYEGFITHKTPGSPKSKVTFFVTKSKSGRFVFTILGTSYTIINA